MTLPAALLRLFGRLSLALSLLAMALVPFGVHPVGRSLGAYLMLLAILAAISLFVLVAARLRQHNDPLAARAVPSCLAAYLLFGLMALRWLAD